MKYSIHTVKLRWPPVTTRHSPGAHSKNQCHRPRPGQHSASQIYSRFEETVSVSHKLRVGRNAVYSTVSTCASRRTNINLNTFSAIAFLYEKDLWDARYMYIL